jgi:predicted phosphodiesterase
MYRLRQFIPKAEQIQIIPVGDIHLGSPNCNLKYLKDTLDYIAKTPDCYVIGMGDYIESILPKDSRFDPSQDFKIIDEYVENMKQILLPIREKILCLLTGNHEYHLHTDGYGDITMRLSKELQVAYAGFSCFLRLETKEKPVRKIVIYAHHGWFSGRLRGAKINNLENMMRDYEADVYLAGHSHDLFATRRVRLSWEGAKKIVFANTGSFLETSTWGTCGYGERAGYPPQKLGVVKLKWYPEQNDIHVIE